MNLHHCENLKSCIRCPQYSYQFCYCANHSLPISRSRLATFSFKLCVISLYATVTRSCVLTTWVLNKRATIISINCTGTWWTLCIPLLRCWTSKQTARFQQFPTPLLQATQQSLACGKNNDNWRLTHHTTVLGRTRITDLSFIKTVMGRPFVHLAMFINCTRCLPLQYRYKRSKELMKVKVMITVAGSSATLLPFYPTPHRHTSWAKNQNITRGANVE
jgi:hypothetical protein